MGRHHGRRGGLFGGLFDFNRDGKTSAGESWIAYQILKDIARQDSPTPPVDADWEDEADDFFPSPRQERALKVNEEEEEEEEEAEENESEGDGEDGADALWQEEAADGEEDWREEAENAPLFGLDPEDYETRADFDAALLQAQILWMSDGGEDAPLYDVDPGDYDTLEEFRAALDAARGPEEGEEEADDEGASCPVSQGPEDGPGHTPLPPCPDTQRGREAWETLEGLEEGTLLCCSQEEWERQHTLCRYILHPEDCPAKGYLTVANGMLLAQAVQDHFSLPCTFPPEDARPLTDLSDLVHRVARRDPALAVEVWDWCLEQFSPFLPFYPDEGEPLHNFVLEDLPKACLPPLLDRLEARPDFARRLLAENPQLPAGLPTLIPQALSLGRTEGAKLLFSAFLSHPLAHPVQVEQLVDDCIRGCSTWEELDTMERFRDHLYPLIAALGIRELTDLLPQWDRAIAGYIDEMERTDEQYAYCRRYAWRAAHKDRADTDEDPLDYETEAEFLAAVEAEQNQWREDWRDEAEQYHLCIQDYPTQEAFQAALDQAVQAQREAEERARREAQQARREAQQKARREAAQERARQQARARSEPPSQPIAQVRDDTVYPICGVLFNSGPVYHYLCPGLSLSVGDRVLVPVGRQGRQAQATVVCVMHALPCAAPYPVEQMQQVLSRLEPEGPERVGFPPGP